MSENLPHHDEQWDDLPLPNEEEAWQKMQLLLEQKDKRRRLPFWFWQFTLLGILVGGMATGGYFFLAKKGKVPTETTSTDAVVPPQKNDKQQPTQREPEKNNVSLHTDKGTTATNNTSGEKTRQPFVINRENQGFEKQRLPKASANTVKDSFSRLSSLPKNKISVNAASAQKQREGGMVRNDSSQDSVVGKNAFANQPQDTTQTVVTPPADSTAGKDSAGTGITTPADSIETQKQASKKKNLIVFSAGIGMQQAIAFGGQQTSSYNLNGKQNTFSDHLPSVYLRLQKGKWFIQGELHYNAPQPVEPFSFSQVTGYDGASTRLQTDRLFVQKLYYHQFPFSINYFVLPDWSWGAGVVYSHFAGAVTRQETTNRNLVTGDETATSRIIPVKGYKDSFLYKSTTGIILQTDYHWKRFSFGLRYTSYLQPFIKYTQPDGSVWDKKNHVLQAILRFKLS